MEHNYGSLYECHFWDLALGLEMSKGLGRSGVVPVVVLKTLLGPLKVHARLGRECLQHFLLFWGEGGHWAGGRRWNDKYEKKVKLTCGVGLDKRPMCSPNLATLGDISASQNKL